MKSGATRTAFGRDAPTPTQEVTRRELLSYAWLAALGIVTLQVAGVAIGFILRRLSTDRSDSGVDIGLIEELPGPGAAPISFESHGFWWVHTQQGALALYNVCPHLGCVLDWKADQLKFTCPCHGSRFARQGDLVSGPAHRNLDRLVISALDVGGREVARTDENGGALAIPAGSRVIVETSQVIVGESPA